MSRFKKASIWFTALLIIVTIIVTIWILSGEKQKQGIQEKILPDTEVTTEIKDLNFYTYNMDKDIIIKYYCRQ